MTNYFYMALIEANRTITEKQGLQMKEALAHLKEVMHDCGSCEYYQVTSPSRFIELRNAVRQGMNNALSINKH
jgi:hypothetical protein